MRSNTEWKPGSYGAGKRHWHVYRIIDGQQQQASDARGRYRWFASMAAAQRCADGLKVRAALESILKGAERTIQEASK